MMKHANTVLVGKTAAAPASGSGSTAVYATNYDTVAEFTSGEIFLVDEKMNLIATNAQAIAAKEVRFALKTADTFDYADTTGAVTTAPVIKYSAPIKRGSIKSAVYGAYSAPTEDKILFDFTDVVPVIGNRYVVRFIYRDIYEHPGQFTKTYEVIATTTDINDLIQGIKSRINKDYGRRINVIATTAADTGNTTDVTSSAVKLLATAKVKNDNEGKESINIYTQVSMKAVAYYTNPSATGFASKNKYPIASLDITKTQGGPGKGWWKIVRDREQAALANKGITYRTTWPYSLLKPALNVIEGETYDQLVVEFENQYLTPDNQRNSNTSQTSEIYITGTLAGSVLAARFDAFNV